MNNNMCDEAGNDAVFAVINPDHEPKAQSFITYTIRY